ncbi:amidase family protein [Streptomyces tsukubensis]
MKRRALLAVATALGTVSLPGAANAAGGGKIKDVMDSTAPYRSSARAQLAALRRGRISARDLVERVLAHHAAVNPGLNAVVTLDAAAARAAADRADAHRAATGRSLGALHGLPITVKDAFETQGMLTTCGSPDLSGHVPAADADVVTLLRRAGAVIVGKSNVPAMCQDLQTANPLFGKTSNPFSPEYTAGGSSGGAAVAVATGMSALEIGSDLAGSLRLPAAYCGAWALRTSRGAVPIVPVRGHIPRPPGWLTSSDMLTVGPVARSADDLDLLLGVIAAPAPADADAWTISLPAPAKVRLGRCRVGVWADDEFCRVDAETRDLMSQVVAALRAAGAETDESTRPVDFARSTTLFERLMYATSSATASEKAFADEVKAASLVADDAPAARYLRSRTMSHRDWAIADEERQKYRSAWADYFGSHDVLITPATPTAAVLDQSSVPAPNRYITVDGVRRSFYDQTTWLNLASLVGLPALVLPTGKTSRGLPMAIQIIGPYLADRSLIAFARALGKVLPEPPKVPAMSQ